MGNDIKNQISHRAEAVKKLTAFLSDYTFYIAINMRNILTVILLFLLSFLPYQLMTMTTCLDGKHTFPTIIPIVWKNPLTKYLS